MSQSHRERIRAITQADAFVLGWPERIGQASPEHVLVLESGAEVVGVVGYALQHWPVTRNRSGWWPHDAQPGNPNTVVIQSLRMARGVPLARLRTLLRWPRLVAMELGLEWVGCRLDESWCDRAALERWNADDVLLWLFWREAFVDVAQRDQLVFLWRNTAY